MKGDLGRSWDRLLDSMYTKYKGCLIEHNPGGSFSWRGCVFLTLDAAKREIDKAFPKLNESINRLK